MMPAGKKIDVTALKNAFKEGATPDENDYASLIDLARMGSRALGSPDDNTAVLNPGQGLMLQSDGRIGVKAEIGKGVTASEAGVAVNVDDKSVQVSGKGLALKLQENGGIDLSGGLHIKTGAGVKTGADGLEIALAASGGLTTTSDNKLALAVDGKAGLVLDPTNGLSVKLAPGADNYLTSGDKGLALTADGVAKIQEAIKKVSDGALDKAVAATSRGFKTDTNDSPESAFENKIAAKLNEAYAEGWSLQRAREALFTALQTFRKEKIGESTIPADDSVFSPSALPDKPGFYSRSGNAFTAQQQFVLRVKPDGTVTEPVLGGLGEDQGIYALFGKTRVNGEPYDDGIHFSRHILMIVAFGGHSSIVGHWDFNAPNTAWASGDGGWVTAPTYDASLYLKGVTDGTTAENSRIISDEKPKWEKDANKQGRQDEIEIIRNLTLPSSQEYAQDIQFMAGMQLVFNIADLVFTQNVDSHSHTHACILLSNFLVNGQTTTFSPLYAGVNVPPSMFYLGLNQGDKNIVGNLESVLWVNGNGQLVLNIRPDAGEYWMSRDLYGIRLLKDPCEFCFEITSKNFVTASQLVNVKFT
ncbi:hypothetical protein N7583_23810 [Serratia marcescens]|uniref:hypothetical protein n=1 Tax=Serratia marcescens TaxID=615 RepID=UPI0028827AC6|nr:hypothetical protein [Serratia marcescens]MDT0228793.1 hypothetical protein [Serratia marcescens]